MASRIRRTDTFPAGISPNVNLKAQLEFELAYVEATVQHVSHYTLIFVLQYKAFRQISKNVLQSSHV